MSSFISKQKIKVEEFFGAHKTKDSRYQHKKEAIINLEISMRNIKNMILGLGASLTTIASFSRNFADELSKIYDKTCPFRVVALQLTDSFTSVQEIIKEISKSIHGLQNNFKEWFVGFDHLKISFKNFEDERRKFDHYTRKVEKLRQMRVAKSQRNQSETGKEIEKMQRNEKKYEDSKAKYEKIRNDSMKQIQKILENRFNLLNPVVLKLVQSEKNALDKLVTSFKPLESIEGDLQRLKLQFDEELKKKQEKSDDSEDDVSEQKTKRETTASPDKEKKVNKDNINNTILQESFMASRLGDSFANWGNNFANSDQRMSIGGSNLQNMQQFSNFQQQNPNQSLNNFSNFQTDGISNFQTPQQSFRGTNIQQSQPNNFFQNNQNIQNIPTEFGDFNNFGRSNFANPMSVKNVESVFGNFSPIVSSNQPNPSQLSINPNSNAFQSNINFSPQGMNTNKSFNFPQQNISSQQNMNPNLSSQFQNMGVGNMSSNPNMNSNVNISPNINMNPMNQISIMSHTANQNPVVNTNQNLVQNPNQSINMGQNFNMPQFQMGNTPQNTNMNQNINMNQNSNMLQNQNPANININQNPNMQGANFQQNNAFSNVSQPITMQQSLISQNNKKNSGNPFDDLI